MSDEVRSALNQTGSALAALTVLKKICDHPALLTERARQGVMAGAARAAGGGRGPMNGTHEEEEDSEIEKGNAWDNDGWLDAAAAQGGTETALLEEARAAGLGASCKTAFVLRLLRDLQADGHRTLVFSQSRRMLDLLEAGARAEGWRLLRVDGGVASAEERQRRVAEFQSDPGIPLFLLTSAVGGLGLTLTAANRVM